MINITKKGGKLTESHKKAISKALKGRIISEEARRKQSISRSGIKHTEEAKHKMSVSQKLLWSDPEYKEEQISKRIGKKRSAEFCRHQSEMQKGEKGPMWGKHHSEETKRKISEANKGEKNATKRPEVRAKLAGPNNPRWRGGVSFKKYCFKFNNRFKEEIRIRFNRTCVVCGKHEKYLKRKLAIHHTDYNKNSICNGKAWAFIPLCDSCHGKTNHKCWYWFNVFINYWCYYKEIQINIITDDNIIPLKYDSLLCG